jgi:hypothetical protein
MRKSLLPKTNLALAQRAIELRAPRLTAVAFIRARVRDYQVPPHPPAHPRDGGGGGESRERTCKLIY